MTINIIEQACEQLAAALVEQTESLIKETIKNYLHKDNICLATLAGRMEMVKLPDGIEIFYLDKVPLLEFHSMETGWSDADYKIVVKRKYRRLL